MSHRQIRTKIAPILLAALAAVLAASPHVSAQANRPFLTAVPYDSGGGVAASVAVADLNNDGNPDIVIANGCLGCGPGSVGVLLGLGDGTFQPVKSYSLPDLPAVSVAVGDLNGDQKPDLVVATGCVSSSDCNTGGVAVLLGVGDGTFQPAVVYGSGGQSDRAVAIADLNRDGHLDVVVTNCTDGGSCFSNTGTVGILLGNGDGTLQTAVSYNSGGSYAWSLAIADLNRDTIPDVVVLNRSGTSSPAVLGILLGRGDGILLPATTKATDSSSGGAVAIADLNGDGIPDLAIANGEVEVMLGVGDGTFLSGHAFDSGGSFPNALAVADVNHDGRLDLLVANYTCKTASCQQAPIATLLGNGDGTFSVGTPRFGSGGIPAVSIVAADLNHDFKPDLVVANQCAIGDNCGEGIVGVLRGTVGFRTTTTIATSLSPSLYGQAVTWTSTVATPGPVPPSGTVKYTRNGFTIGTAQVDANGTAALTRSNLNASSIPIIATYEGDTYNGPSTSAVLTQLVNATISSASLTSSPNPSTQGQAVTFTATISSPTVLPSGPVTFFVGGVAVATVQLSGGKARFTTSTLSPGSSVVKATYLGNSNIAGSSAKVTEVVH